MKLVKYRFYRGPNIWAGQSGIFLLSHKDQASLSWSLLAGKAMSSALKNFNALLSSAAPVAQESEYLGSLRRWQCEKDKEAYGLLAIAEIIARDFCLQPALGYVIKVNGEVLQLFLPCDEEVVGLSAVHFAITALQLAPGAIIGNEQDFRARIAEEYQRARTRSRQFGLNQSTLGLARRALQRGIPVTRRLVPGQYIQLGQGRKARTVMETATSVTSMTGRMMSSDKFTASAMLSRGGLPTPGTQAASSVEEAWAIAQRLGYPLVVKPRSSGKGSGVCVDIRTPQELQRALKAAAEYRQGLIVERHVVGDDYRLLVVGGRFVAAAKRLPAQVTGDGQSTVEQLVEQENRDPQRGMSFERLREKIEMDAEAFQQLAFVGMDEKSIPAAGQAVRLRGTANISRGGTSVDVTDVIHPDNRRLAERAARLVGLDIAGIDFLTPDITRSWREVPAAILEVNATPGLRPHLGANSDRDVFSPIIDYLFPDPAQSRVPTVGITGSVGKTTTAQMVSAILNSVGRTVAMATTQGSWIGKERLRSGDMASGYVGQQLLNDPMVDAGVFELARGGLLKSGMALDSVDVGVVLNVFDNHVGIDGIGSRGQLAGIKSLVVRHARKWAVINADDPLCLKMRKLTSAPQICLVSMHPDNPETLQHLAESGTAVTLHGAGAEASFRLQTGDVNIGEIGVTELSATMNGQFMPPMFNAMFAAAAAHALGVPFASIRAALQDFRSDYTSNPGRMNRVDGLPFELILAHSDGPQALAEIARYARGRASCRPKVYIICAAGNRPDQFLIDSGKAVAGAFDQFICTDMGKELRGRPPGATPGLLAEGLRQAGVPDSAITIERSSSVAVETALRGMPAGALLLIECYQSEKVIEAVKSIWPMATL